MPVKGTVAVGPPIQKDRAQKAAPVLVRSHSSASLAARYLGVGVVISSVMVAAAWVADFAPVTVAFISVILLVGGYLTVDHVVRRPLQRLTEALKAENAGGGKTLQSEFSDEMRSLVDSFDHIRLEATAHRYRLQNVLDNTSESVVTIDKQGVILAVNRATEKLFGYEVRELIGKRIELLIARRSANVDMNRISDWVGQEREANGCRKGGGHFSLAMKTSALTAEGETRYVVFLREVGERHAVMENLKRVAERDPVTGLHNRSYFQEELERVVERAQRVTQHCALLYIDLDNFKNVNDKLGPAAGDRLLTEVGGVLFKRARKGDLLARLGGDEFALLVYDVDTAQAAVAADSFRALLSEYPFRHQTQRVYVACSIGVAPIGKDAESSAIVLAQAETACRLAKRGGRNRTRIHLVAEQNKSDETTSDAAWTRRLRDAMENNRFVLATQPIVNARSGEVDSQEILLRLCDQGESVLAPDDFLPIAERLGLAADVDRWVILHTIQLLAQQRGQASMRCNVNLSRQSLSQPDICDLIATRLRVTGVDPALLGFEVTESAIVADIGMAEAFLTKLRGIGCRTLLDNVGVGLSSPFYLRHLPVDGVKIDLRYMHDLSASPVDQAIVGSIVQLAHALGRYTIAESVENPETLAAARELGIDFAQGFQIARPALPN